MGPVSPGSGPAPLLPTAVITPPMVLPTMTSPPVLFAAAIELVTVFARQLLVGSPISTNPVARETEIDPVWLPQMRTVAGAFADTDPLRVALSRSRMAPLATLIPPVIVAPRTQVVPLVTTNAEWVPVIVTSHSTVNVPPSEALLR